MAAQKFYAAVVTAAVLVVALGGGAAAVRTITARWRSQVVDYGDQSPMLAEVSPAGTRFLPTPAANGLLTFPAGRWWR
jgi:hypothetical protein